MGGPASDDDDESKTSNSRSEREILSKRLKDNLRRQQENYNRQKGILEKLRNNCRSESVVENIEQKPSYAVELKELHVEEEMNQKLAEQLDALRKIQLENSRKTKELSTLQSQYSVLEERCKMKDEQLTCELSKVGKIQQELDEWKRKAMYLTRSVAQKEETLSQRQKSLEREKEDRERLEYELNIAYEREQQLTDISTSHALELQEALDHVQKQLQSTRVREKTLITSKQEADVHIQEIEIELHHVKEYNKVLQHEVNERNRQCQAIEEAATGSVGKIQNGMQNVERAYAKEREGRRRAEVERDAAQKEVETIRSKIKVIRENSVSRNEFEEQQQKYETNIKSLSEARAEIEKYFGEMKRKWTKVGTYLAGELEDITVTLEKLQKEYPSNHQIIHAEKKDGAVNPLQEMPIVGSLVQRINTLSIDCHHRARTLSRGLESQVRDMALATSRIKQLEEHRDGAENEIRQLHAQILLAQKAQDSSTQDKLDVLKAHHDTCQELQQTQKQLKDQESGIKSVSNRLQFKGLTGKSDHDDQDVLKVLETHAQACVERLIELQNKCREQDIALRKLDSTCRHQSTEFSEYRQEAQNEIRAITEAYEASIKEFESRLNIETQAFGEKSTENTEQLVNLQSDYALKEQELQDCISKNHGLNAQLKGVSRALELCLMLLVPLISQTKDIREQKRYLTKQLGRFEAARVADQQITRLICQYADSSDQETLAQSERKRFTFRGIALAILAFNRFQKIKGESYGFPITVNNHLVLPCKRSYQIGIPQGEKLADLFEEIDLPSLMDQIRKKSKSTNKFSKLFLSTLRCIDRTALNVLDSSVNLGWLEHIATRRRRPSSIDFPERQSEYLRRSLKTFLERIRDAEHQRTALQKESYELQQCLDEHRAQLDHLKPLLAENKTLQARVQSLEKHLKENNPEELKESYQRLKKDFDCQVEELRRQVTEREIQLVSAKQTIVSLEQKINTQERILLDSESQLKRACVDRDKQFDATDRTMSKKEAELADLRQALKVAHGQLQEARESEEKSKSQIDELEQRLQVSKTEISTLESQYKAVLLESESKMPEQKASAANSTDDLTEMESMLNRIQEVTSLVAKCHEKTSRTPREILDPVAEVRPVDATIDEAEKINSAVHDYMDRIDHKLLSFYGIPKTGDHGSG